MARIVTEGSPRDIPLASLGAIRVAYPHGLLGQVIINGHACTTTACAGYWVGQVVIQQDDPDAPLVLSPDQTDPDLHAPYYGANSAKPGGGAVGLVPCRLYESDCIPPHHDNWAVASTDVRVLNTQFSHTAGVTAKDVRARFYSPVATANAPSTAVTVWYFLYRLGNYVEWADVTGRCTVEMHQTNSSLMGREVVVHGNGSTLPPGYYAITFADTGGDRVYCDGTTSTAPPSPKPNIVVGMRSNIEYHFRLFPDCDADDVEDDTSSGPAPCEWVCIADVDDGSGTGTTDAGVTVDDLLFYLVLFNAGDPRADLTDGNGGGPDGGVTIDDLLLYLNHFYAGC